MPTSLCCSTPRGPEAMLLFLFLLAGLAAGLCRGGSLRRAAAFPLRGLWLPLAAYLLKALGGPIGVPPLPLCLAQYGLLLLFCWFNRRQPRWCAPFALGTALNFAVIAANGGRQTAGPRWPTGWPRAGFPATPWPVPPPAWHSWATGWPSPPSGGCWVLPVPAIFCWASAWPPLLTAWCAFARPRRTNLEECARPKTRGGRSFLSIKGPLAAAFRPGRTPAAAALTASLKTKFTFLQKRSARLLLHSAPHTVRSNIPLPH